MSFETLKKQSRLGTLTEKLVKEVEKSSARGSVDDRFWKPEMDKGGTGYAVIRFLPAPEGEDMPWAKVFSHAFQGPGGWLIDNCLTTNGGKCPVCAENNTLWNSGLESDKNIARNRKRKLSYYSNIYVVKDPLHPENEGKVFLYKFGKKIHDKILAAMQPEFEDEEAIDPFDFWQGANFKLKLAKVDGYWNYDKSEFAATSALLDDDDALEAIWNKEYSLQELVALDKFKSYDDLEKRLNAVLGVGKVAPKSQSFDEEEKYEAFSPKTTKTDNVMEQLEEAARSARAPEPPETMKRELANLSSMVDKDEDDAMAMFNALANDDF